jgi:hypothetical protein
MHARRTDEPCSGVQVGDKSERDEIRTAPQQDPTRASSPSAATSPALHAAHPWRDELPLAAGRSRPSSTRSSMKGPGRPGGDGRTRAHCMHVSSSSMLHHRPSICLATARATQVCNRYIQTDRLAIDDN